MTLSLRRLWPLLFVLAALLFSSTIYASESTFDQSVSTEHEGERQEANAEQVYAHVDDHEQSSLNGLTTAPPPDIPGAALYRDASLILQKLRLTPRRATRFIKPTGIFGTFLHYGRELFLLLFMNGPTKIDSSSSSSTRRITGPLLSAVKLLEEAAGTGNADAIYTLAEINFYGYYTHPRDYSKAYEHYSTLAALNGNASAQHMIGFMYGTGIGGAVEKDQARALLYHTFAADGGDVRSQMTTAFRHHAGIGTTRNCEKSVHYYKLVADKAIEYMRSGPPGGRSETKEVYRLADEEGGLYGDGASVSSSGMNAKQGTNAEANSDFDNVLEYMDYMARKGELRATFNLGRVHYDGSRGLKPDFATAKTYFYDVARRYWTKDGKIRPDTEPGVDKLASKAASYLGMMFLRGEGMPQNFAKARIWFRRGIENGDALSQYSMGLMHLQGLDMPVDPFKAANFFAAAADQNLASAQVQFGILLLDQGDIATATKYFELASQSGHIEAFYYLAELNNLSAGRNRNCNTAALFYKIVAEKADSLHSRFEEANEAYVDRDLETALPLYMMAAEQGYEAGQNNVAFLLDQPHSGSTLARFFPYFKRKASTLLGDASLALIYWTRSAKQANIDSLVKMGDYYLWGLGTDNSLPDPEKAAACYTAAADSLQSSQAMWNLGWMHENGIGMEQDFHLAKRLYDQSADTNREAYSPVAMALFKLRVRSWWNWVSGGEVKGIRDDDLPRKRYTLTEWISNFLAADYEAYEAEQLARAEGAAGDVGLDEWDSSAMPGGDGEGFYGAGDELDWLDDELLEAFVILGLAATLALLIYWRQQRIVRQRAAAQAQAQALAQGQGQGLVGVGQALPAQPPPPQQQQDRGLFPPNNEPEFINWAMGGIGH